MIITNIFGKAIKKTDKNNIFLYPFALVWWDISKENKNAQTVWGEFSYIVVIY